MTQSTPKKTFQYDAKRRVTADRTGLLLGFLLLLTLPLLVHFKFLPMPCFWHLWHWLGIFWVSAVLFPLVTPLFLEWVLMALR